MADRPVDPQERAYFEFLSRCDEAFRPHAPIELPQFFAGRAAHLERLASELSAPGRHVAVFGERGVGKTSLVQLAYFFLRRHEDRTFYSRCSSNSTFDTIFSTVLAKAGKEYYVNGIEADSARHAALGAGALRAGRKHTTRTVSRRLSGAQAIDPQLLLDTFGEFDGLIVVDEFDRVGDTETHVRVAELLKQFSDANSRTKIIVVGVAETVSQLIGEHQSLSRSLAQIKLDRMSDEELEQIVLNGQEHIQATFKVTTRRRIVRLSDGFPYFVHLLCRHAARIGARLLLHKPDERPVIADEEYQGGLNASLENAQASLVEGYEKATITTRRKSDRFELVLWAMALADTKDVQVQDIAKNSGFFTSEEAPKASSFSSTLGELSKETRGCILTKVRDGYYKFTDPLMRPYVRCLLESERLLTPGQQWEFPFMLSG